MTDYANRIKADIKKYGVHIIHVMAEGDEPNFSYTIGLYELHKKPEIIIIGQTQELHQTLLNNMAYDYQDGKIFKNGELTSDILDEYDCMMLDVDQIYYEEYVGIALDYYKGENFPVMQIIWPTSSKLFPYEEGAPGDFKKWQPVLGKI